VTEQHPARFQQAVQPVKLKTAKRKQRRHKNEVRTYFPYFFAGRDQSHAYLYYPRDMKEKLPHSQFPLLELVLCQKLVWSMMGGRFLALVILFWGSFSATVNGKCPCEDQSLCEPIARPPGKEFLMFSTKPNVWRKYDWTKVTTIALFRPWDDEMMCEAHKRVRNQLIYLSVILLT